MDSTPNTPPEYVSQNTFNLAVNYYLRPPNNAPIQGPTNNPNPIEHVNIGPEPVGDQHEVGEAAEVKGTENNDQHQVVVEEEKEVQASDNADNEKEGNDWNEAYDLLYPEVNNPNKKPRKNSYEQGAASNVDDDFDDDFNWNLAYETIFPEENHHKEEDVVPEHYYEQWENENTQPATWRESMNTPEWAKGYETDPGAEYVDGSDEEARRQMEYEWMMHDPWEDERSTDSDCSFDSIFSY